MSSTADSIQTGSGTFVLNDSDNRQSKKGGAIILGVSVATALIAGVLTSRGTTKKSLKHYAKKMKQTPVPLESPYMLAFKALGIGTILAVGGVSLITVATCLCLDIRSMDDLREKIRKNRGPEDPSTNFKTFQEFFNYIVKESKKSKSNAEQLEAKS